MEHLHLRWVPTITNSGAWKIVTDEAEPWIIAELAVNLPGDQTGEITASAICRLHNLHIGVAP